MTGKTGKVWVVQENPRMDYSPAEAFGEIRFMTADEFRPMAASLKNEDIKADVERGAAEFVAETDWLVLTGNPIMIGYAFHLVHKENSRVRFLQWDRIRGEYRPYTFEVA